MDIKTFKIVKLSDLQPNDYNPNVMASVEMHLLCECIKKYGFLFPIITTYDEKISKHRIIDGEHRYKALSLMNEENAPIIDLQISVDEAMQLTILMNRIKGIHKVTKMGDIVNALEENGMALTEIARNLGMEKDEIYRLRTTIGIASAFSNHEFSKSWEVE
jgi:ParB-like chromosome segregation protein Spo0J